jgi:DEAD/DEAH box helicase domain-containing protein
VAIGEGDDAEPTPGHKPPRADALALAAAGSYRPRIFIYDNYPGGIGMSEPLFRVHERLLSHARSLIASCPCSHGCPSCTGPAGETGHAAKQVALAILEAITTGFATESRRHGED